MTYYINQDKEEYTQQELIDLCTGTAKPMWTCSTYEPEYEGGVLAETIVCVDDWQGFMKEYDIDYSDLESPYMRQEFKREVLAIALEYTCSINQWENMIRHI